LIMKANNKRVSFYTMKEEVSKNKVTINRQQFEDHFIGLH